MLSLVTAIVKPHKLVEVKEALNNAGVQGLTIAAVVRDAAQTGKIGDGKIWVTPREPRRADPHR